MTGLTHLKGDRRVLKISGKGLRAAFVLITALVVSASAQAATIDFGSVSWVGADDLATHSVGDVTATAGPEGAKLAWTAGFGLGVNYANAVGPSLDDESPEQISLQEVLTISFDTPTLLDSFTVSNLFRETPCTNGCGNRNYDELGSTAPTAVSLGWSSRQAMLGTAT